MKLKIRFHVFFFFDWVFKKLLHAPLYDGFDKFGRPSTPILSWKRAKENDCYFAEWLFLSAGRQLKRIPDCHSLISSDAHENLKSGKETGRENRTKKVTCKFKFRLTLLEVTNYDELSLSLFSTAVFLFIVLFGKATFCFHRKLW